MKLLAALALAVLPALPALAQEQVSEGQGASLRVLDKISGETSDYDVRSGEAITFGRIEVSVEDCRYPSGNQAGDAFAHVTVRLADKPDQQPLFAGWMVASAPALNALDHPRYDVWVLTCLTG